jgi:hypothetical protein
LSPGAGYWVLIASGGAARDCRRSVGVGQFAGGGWSPWGNTRALVYVHHDSAAAPMVGLRQATCGSTGRAGFRSTATPSRDRRSASGAGRRHRDSERFASFWLGRRRPVRAAVPASATTGPAASQRAACTAVRDTAIRAGPASDTVLPVVPLGMPSVRSSSW